MTSSNLLSRSRVSSLTRPAPSQAKCSVPSRPLTGLSLSVVSAATDPALSLSVDQCLHHQHRPDPDPFRTIRSSYQHVTVRYINLLIFSWSCKSCSVKVIVQFIVMQLKLYFSRTCQKKKINIRNLRKTQSIPPISSPNWVTQLAHPIGSSN